MTRKKRRRTDVGVEPNTHSENPAKSLDNCAQSNFNSNSSKLSKEGQKLSGADPKANPMVAQKPILHIQRKIQVAVKLTPTQQIKIITQRL